MCAVIAIVNLIHRTEPQAYGIYPRRFKKTVYCGNIHKHEVLVI